MTLARLERTATSPVAAEVAWERVRTLDPRLGSGTAHDGSHGRLTVRDDGSTETEAVMSRSGVRSYVWRLTGHDGSTEFHLSLSVAGDGDCSVLKLEAEVPPALVPEMCLLLEDGLAAIADAILDDSEDVS